MRDIIVYKCDICDREVQLQRKPHTIETVGKCIITSNCRGSLYVERLIKTSSPFLKRTEEVVGVENFYKRNKFFKFTQRYEKSTWLINHNLETFPIISVYDINKEIISDSDFTVDVINKNTLKVNFRTSVSGTAELYIREVAVTETFNSNTNLEEAIPVSTNSSTCTIALLSQFPRTEEIQNFEEDGITPILDSSGSPTFTKELDTIRFKLTSSTGQIQFNSVEVERNNTNSPWAGVTKVTLKNKTYYVGFIDFFSNGFNSSLVSNGTTIEIDESDQKVSHFLLSDPPFEKADLLKNKILEVSKINMSSSSLFFDNDEVFCDNTLITKLYPNIITS